MLRPTVSSWRLRSGGHGELRTERQGQDSDDRLEPYEDERPYEGHIFGPGRGVSFLSEGLACSRTVFDGTDTFRRPRNGTGIFRIGPGAGGDCGIKRETR